MSFLPKWLYHSQWENNYGALESKSEQYQRSNSVQNLYKRSSRSTEAA